MATQHNNVSKIEQQELGHAIEDNMMRMSIEVLTNRALPFLEDGFKPSQRKILYTMKNMGLYNKLAKSANIDGQNMKLNAHGSSYLTLVRLTREKEALLTPFVYGKGAFGKIYSSNMEPAAARYSEAQLAPICHELMDGLNKHNSNFVDNYDGTMKEPMLLSAPFPNILANPQDGIGIGFACSFPSYNLIELCDSCISILKGNDDINTIKSIMPGPDFTTGASLMIEPAEIDKIYTTGTGRCTLRAKFNDDTANNILEVIEIPYTTTAERIIADVQKQYDKGKFPEINDINDEIGIDGFKVAIFYKKGTDVQNLIEKLYALTSLQDYHNSNMTLVYNNRPVTMGVIEIIQKWIEHRKVWVQEELNYDIIEKTNQLHLLVGLEKILLDIDKAVSIVKSSKTDEDVIDGLCNNFSIDKIQAEFVANIKLRNFNQDYILNKTKEITTLRNDIEVLKNTNIVDKMISDLERVKQQYGVPRKTEIVYDWNAIDTTKVLAPVNKNSNKNIQGKSVLFVGLDTVKRAQENTTAKTPDGTIRFDDVDNNDELLIFTTLGRVFKLRVHRLKMNNQNELSTFFKKSLEIGETIIYTTVLRPCNDIVILFDNNKIARYSQKAYTSTGNKHCFKNGYNTKAIALHIEAVSENNSTIIYNNKTIDISKLKTKDSRLTSGVNIKL